MLLLIFGFLWFGFFSTTTVYSKLTVAPFQFIGNRTEIRIVHIAKTAGTSFYTEVNDHHVFPKIPHTEKCYNFMVGKYNRHRHYFISFFREPRAHVFSQYLECKYDNWGKEVTAQTSFPHGKTDAEGFSAWIDHFHSSWNQHDDGVVKLTNDNYNCYLPYNFQLRTFAKSCTKEPHNFNGTSSFQEELPDVLRGLNTLDMLGITEYYGATMCMFWYYTKQAHIWQNECANNSTVKHQQIKHNVPPHNPDQLDSVTLTKVDELTRLDRIVYRFALYRFLENVKLYEKMTNTSLQELIKLDYNVVLAAVKFD